MVKYIMYLRKVFLTLTFSFYNKKLLGFLFLIIHIVLFFLQFHEVREITARYDTLIATHNVSFIRN